MSLYEEKLCELEKKHRAQIRGLMNAKGLIAEAESVCAAINQHLETAQQPSVLTTVHDDGSVEVYIYVWHHHADVRQAMESAGLLISTESALIENTWIHNRSHSNIGLAGFDCTLRFEGEAAWTDFFAIKEAA